MAEKKTLARPYAKAAFQYALSGDDLDKWSLMLHTAAEMVNNNKVHKVVANPSLSKEKRASFFTEQKELFDKDFSNFISLISAKNRLLLLPEIYGCYEDLKLSYKKQVNVNITSAIPLEDNQKKQLQGVLAKRTGRELKVSYDCSEDLIGGLVVRMGDLVIDNSVKGQLNKMLTELL